MKLTTFSVARTKEIFYSSYIIFKGRSLLSAFKLLKVYLIKSQVEKLHILENVPKYRNTDKI